VIDACIKNGVLTDWFLCASDSLRISPPLTITAEQIKKACEIVSQACNAI
jgi:acetylornithine/N-succinyldiaminopimelate aminotransferase